MNMNNMNAVNLVSDAVKDVNNNNTMSSTNAEIPPAATISAKFDEIFKQIGEKLCGSIKEIVEEKQYMIIANIKKTITKHLESDTVKDVISKKIEEILNTLPNKEELIKNVNNRIQQVVDTEIEKTFTNPDTFSKLKKLLKQIITNGTKTQGGTRKYRVKKNKSKKINPKKNK